MADATVTKIGGEVTAATAGGKAFDSTTPADNETLLYDTATGKWENETAGMFLKGKAVTGDPFSVATASGEDVTTQLVLEYSPIPDTWGFQTPSGTETDGIRTWIRNADENFLVGVLDGTGKPLGALGKIHAQVARDGGQCRIVVDSKDNQAQLRLISNSDPATPPNAGSDQDGLIQFFDGATQTAEIGTDGSNGQFFLATGDGSPKHFVIGQTGAIGVNTSTKLTGFTVKQFADITALKGSDDANVTTDSGPAATTLNLSANAQALLDLGVGDRVALSSDAVKYATIKGITNDTTITLGAGLGDGNPGQTILVKHAPLSVIASDSSPLLMLSDRGRLGIGNKSPNRKLHIREDAAATACSMMIASDQAKVNIEMFADTDNAATGANEDCCITFNSGLPTSTGVFQGEIRYDNTEDAITLNAQTQNSDQLVIKDNGRIGIGIVEPVDRLSLQGAMAMKSRAEGSPDVDHQYGKVFALAYEDTIKLHVKASGSDGDTDDFLDGTTNHTVELKIGAEEDSAQTVFGAGTSISLNEEFDGTVFAHVEVDNHADWVLGSNDFTIEGHFRINSALTAIDNRRNFVYKSTDANRVEDVSFEMYYVEDTDKLTFRYVEVGQAATVYEVDWIAIEDVWYHIVAERSGTELKLYVDGTQKGTAHTIATKTIASGTGPLLWGLGKSAIGVSRYPFRGWIDNMQISVGKARYGGGASFPAPTTIHGQAEMYVLDGDDNQTKISPHNAAGEWEYFSRNKSTGKTVRINMERMIKDIEALTGNSYIEDK